MSSDNSSNSASSSSSTKTYQIKPINVDVKTLKFDTVEEYDTVFQKYNEIFIEAAKNVRLLTEYKQELVNVLKDILKLGKEKFGDILEDDLDDELEEADDEDADESSDASDEDEAKITVKKISPKEASILEGVDVDEDIEKGEVGENSCDDEDGEGDVGDKIVLKLKNNKKAAKPEPKKAGKKVAKVEPVEEAAEEEVKPEPKKAGKKVAKVEPVEEATEEVAKPETKKAGKKAAKIEPVEEAAEEVAKPEPKKAGKKAAKAEPVEEATEEVAEEDTKKAGKKAKK